MGSWSSITDQLREELGTRRENYNMDAPSASVTLRCPNKPEPLKYNVIKSMIWQRALWPYQDAPFALFCNSISMRPDRAKYTAVGAAEELMETDHHVLLDCTYGSNFFTSVQDTENPSNLLFIEESLEPSVEFFTQDPDNFEWETPDPGTQEKRVKKGEEPGIPWYRWTITRTVHGYLDLPTDFLTWAGKVHSGSFWSSYYKLYFAPNTLMFTDPVIKLDYYSIQTSLPSFSLTARLIYQRNGWDKFWRPRCDGASIVYWDRIKLKAQCGGTDDYTPFDQVDMSRFIFPASIAGP